MCLQWNPGCSRLVRLEKEPFSLEESQSGTGVLESLEVREFKFRGSGFWPLSGYLFHTNETGLGSYRVGGQRGESKRVLVLTDES